MKPTLCINTSSQSYQRLLRASTITDEDTTGFTLAHLFGANFTATDMAFIDRSKYEAQQIFKELITYVLILRPGRDGTEILAYVRGSDSNEECQDSKLSVGFGGHIDDMASAHDLVGQPANYVYRQVFQKLHEDLTKGSDFTRENWIPCVEFHSTIHTETSHLNSDQLGLMFIVQLGESDEQLFPITICSSAPSTITETTWVPLMELAVNPAARARLEAWSAIAVDRAFLEYSCSHRDLDALKTERDTGA